MIGNFSFAKLIGFVKKKGLSQPVSSRDGEHGIMHKEITLERIKDIIIEAYAQVDQFKKNQLLGEAESLERQLVTTYRSKGLKLTADNIAHSLKAHKRSQLKRSL